MIELAAVRPDGTLDRSWSPAEHELTGSLQDGDLDATVDVLTAIVQRAGQAGLGLRLSLEPAGTVHDELTARVGMHLVRELLQLRRSLPLPAAVRPAAPLPFMARPFDPERDEQQWLDVNNRAFEWHPEQADWTLDMLRAKEAEPWFDTEGFLVTDVHDRLAGFCWTKIHEDAEGHRLGEIFVIAVDPALHAPKLGTFLAVAGLDWLAEQGIREAMLYVESDNAPARALYAKLGFEVHHARRWWQMDPPRQRQADPTLG